MKNFKTYSVMIYAAMALFSCTKSDLEIKTPKENTQDSIVVEDKQSTIWSVIKESENHNYLEAAVVAAELQGILSNTSWEDPYTVHKGMKTGAFTVLAPTDAAFTDLAEGLGVSIPDLLELPKLRDILLYHVLPEVLREEVLLPASINSMHGTLLTEAPIYFQSNGAGIRVNGVASVTSTDLLAENGVVHVIDKVLLAHKLGIEIKEKKDKKKTDDIENKQPSVWSVIKGSENHNYLEAAVVAAELQGVLSDNTGAFTVLAPTDEAFIDLAVELGVGIPDLLELPSLRDILLYHILPEVLLEEVLLPASINSMHGTLLTEEPIYFQSNGAGIRVNGVASVTSTDLLAENGVVHEINKVLSPL
jgi:transforming growth factor-beta-induced protein